MNRFLPDLYVEHVERLAVGIEPVDAMRGSRVPPPLHVVRDTPLTDADRRALRERCMDAMAVWPSFERHDTCRHVLRYVPGVFQADTPHIDVRLIEGLARLAPRRFVPRRLRIPLVDEETADVRPPGFRVRRPGLYPGAAYPVHETATGLRGRVTRAGAPMRWARVEAREGTTNVLVGRAHGDDRGEFLLLLASEGAGVGEPRTSVSVHVEVFAPANPPPPPAPLVAATDPLWDLPLETLPDTDASDPITRGETRPWSNEVSEARVIELPLGRISSERDPFVIP